MNANTRKLHELGQSLWIDNITRQMLDDGTLGRYIDELSVTGLTSNPTIFEKAIGAGSSYDAQIRELADRGQSGEALFFALALRDLTRAADLFLPIHRQTDGIDGWVSLEVSPLIVDDAKKTIAAAAELHKQAGKPNLYIKIPGTPAGVEAIEASIFAGVPGILTKRLSRAACAWSFATDAVVAAASSARSGDTSSDTQPSRPPLARWIGANSAAALRKSSIASVKNSASSSRSPGAALAIASS